MSKTNVRVRFAPAPTGMMHIGNVRSALLNFLFAKQKNGTFILRIEDTDTERNYDPKAERICYDLSWLRLLHDEGPGVGGAYGPYFQSERSGIYAKHLQMFIEKKFVYRCFCSAEELEKKRLRQQALKQPPRYDRTCLLKGTSEIETLLAEKVPFIWRFKLDHAQSITIHDLGRGDVTFQLAHFSDFPITRQDGSVTFLFANAIDDILMKISHIFRGEDHLSNSALQGAIFVALDRPLPIYWHQPILCNVDGKKLSKRDFGFSLGDLRDAGYFAEAIINYLGIVGNSFKEEIMTIDALISQFDFDNIHASGRITYDAHKLEWINHKWVQKKSVAELLPLCRKFLKEAYGEKVAPLNDQVLTTLIAHLQPEIKVVRDIVTMTAFYFNPPKLTTADFSACISTDSFAKLRLLVQDATIIFEKPAESSAILKKLAEKHGLKSQEVYWFFRLSLMGSTKGPAIGELIQLLSALEARERVMQGILLLHQ